MAKRRIDLGEYIVTIDHNVITGALVVSVLDELEDIIESIHVFNDEDDDLSNDEPMIDLNLN